MSAPAAHGLCDPRERLGEDLARSVLLGLVFLLSWLSVAPFPDLADPAALAPVESGDRLNQAAYLAAAALVCGYLFLAGPSLARPVARPVLAVLLAWLALSVVLSVDPGLSARRLVFTLLVMLIAAIVPLVPRSARHFGACLAVVALVILIVAYAGLVLVPDLAIHQADDIREPWHAGLWRGPFGHKNGAGSMMAVLVLVGLFVARKNGPLPGAAIALPAGVFVVFAGSKTALVLLPLVLALSVLAGRARSLPLLFALLLGPAFVLNALTVGTVLVPALGDLAARVVPDASFTGRTDLWRFAIDNILARPITGYGFSAFWLTGEVMFSATEMDTGGWAQTSVSGHSGYIDLALTTGLVGLGLGLVWAAVLPVLDYHRARAGGADGPLRLFFLRLWMFGLYASCFESILFDRGNSIWFSMLVAIFGLRYLATLRLAP